MAESDAAAPKSPYTVSQLTEEIRLRLEENYDWVQVRGEISGFKRATSGHAYFNLKDNDAILACVAWKNTVLRWAGLDLRDGVEVIVGGGLTLYPPRGQYQMVVSAIRLAGTGALYLRFEALKRRLAEEGFFDPDKKKPLPVLPERIAVITSPSGAAIRDFIKTLRRYSAPVETTVCPVRVQGSEAPREIAEMIAQVDATQRYDLIVLCRGGGSLEDLWAFNEEIVARAIHAAKTPILTGIGHEVDITIADWVADERASTPTGAAQTIGDIFDRHRGKLQIAIERLMRAALPCLDRERRRLEVTRRTIQRYHPRSILARDRQRLDDRAERLRQWMRFAAQRERTTCKELHGALTRFMKESIARRRVETERSKGLLQSYDPRRIFERGFAICRRTDGSLIQHAAQTKIDDEVQVEISGGGFRSLVTDVWRNDE